MKRRKPILKFLAIIELLVKLTDTDIIDMKIETYTEYSEVCNEGHIKDLKDN